MTYDWKQDRKEEVSAEVEGIESDRRHIRIRLAECREGGGVYINICVCVGPITSSHHSYPYTCYPHAHYPHHGDLIILPPELTMVHSNTTGLKPPGYTKLDHHIYTQLQPHSNTTPLT